MDNSSAINQGQYIQLYSFYHYYLIYDTGHIYMVNTDVSLVYEWVILHHKHGLKVSTKYQASVEMLHTWKTKGEFKWERAYVK